VQTNFSKTPITDSMKDDGEKTTGAKTHAPAQDNASWIKEMNQVEENPIDIITGGDDSELPFSLD
jgi:hypothetical protein